MLLLASAALPGAWLDRDPARRRLVARWGAYAGKVVFGFTLVAVAGHLLTGESARLVLAGTDITVFRFDRLAAVVFYLVAFLGVIVARYSRRSLDGNARHGVFTKWLLATLGAVLLLIVSSNLLVFGLAWSCSSLCLHQLLTFYPERPGAVLAARQKAIISRLGDICLIGALILTYQVFGTWDFETIFAQAGVIAADSAQATLLLWLGACLVGAALLKSAQFPFHAWLPDTLETPTPVSALMHAGIINAGGFLVVRFSPLLVETPAVLHVLAVIGGLTALVGAVSMMPQVSVKRTLAYSTVAQMGFMMLQCGLGAFSLAILHLVAHSLYKAYAFLDSGNLGGRTRAPRSQRPAPAPLAWSLLAAVAISVSLGALFGVDPLADPGALVFAGVLLMALTQFLWSYWSGPVKGTEFGLGVVLMAAVGTAYYLLHAFAYGVLEPSVATLPPASGVLAFVVIGLILALFAGVFLLQTHLQTWLQGRRGRAFYLAAYNGFYFSAWAERFLRLSRSGGRLPKESLASSHAR
jgi:NAD(P)H-quinone oxidoreductase subunit 5